jgi:hypothetical protein
VNFFGQQGDHTRIEHLQEFRPQNWPLAAARRSKHWQRPTGSSRLLPSHYTTLV